MYYQRKLLKQIKKHLTSPEIVVITGMRRVGKTTVLKMIFDNIKTKNKVFLDIENPLSQKIFEEDDFNNIWANLNPFAVSNKTKAYLFLDEIQAKPDIVKAIKYLHDHYSVKFFVTGSSSFYLKNLFPESLAGRKVIFELFPLDFEEFLWFKSKEKTFYQSFKQKDKKKNAIENEKLKKFYDEYLQFGGFPQVALVDNAQQKEDRLADIFKSYFEKDVRSLADFKEINIFRDLLLLLLQRVGSKLDISKLASEAGITRATVYSYLSFLEGTYMIALVPLYSKSIDRQVSGAKKVYFCDNGFVNQFSKVSAGSLLENAIFQNIRKYGKVSYYQKRAGSEIDFILDNKLALEVKQRGVEKDYTRLARLAKGLKLKEYYVITEKFINRPGFIPTIEL